jgi:hypothetical protein
MHRSFQLAIRLKRYVRITIFCALASSTIAMAAEDVLFQSTEKQVTLIELFTAEGCSSCPPAEASISKLKADRALWKNLVPIAFHVDYWDGRGWKDRFASPAFTQRQRVYAATWKSGSVYTPAFAVNGREWRGSGTPTPPAAANAGVLKIAGAGNRLAFTYVHSSPSASQWDVHVALLGSGIISKVGGGENSGRELRHDFVVLKYDQLRMTGDAGIARAELDLPQSHLEKGSRPALAAWVTMRDQIVPIQATGGWLR